MELYALKGFSNVSITDLQFALDIGRGTLYYYYKDQDELFYACMERYFLEPKQRALSMANEDAGIDGMIQTMLHYLQGLEDALMTFDVKSINTSNVNNLMFTDYSKFPALHRKLISGCGTGLLHEMPCGNRSGLFYALSPINQVSLLLHCPTGVREYGVKPL